MMDKGGQYPEIVDQLHEELLKVPEGDDKVELDPEVIRRFKLLGALNLKLLI